MSIKERPQPNQSARDIICASGITAKVHLISQNSSEPDFVIRKTFACNRESINIVQHNPTMGTRVQVYSSRSWTGGWTEFLLTHRCDQPHSSTGFICATLTKTAWIFQTELSGSLGSVAQGLNPS